MNPDNSYDMFTEIADEVLLQCNHDGLPTYIPPLKAVLTAGHYTFVSINSGKPFVAEIIQNNQTHLTVCPYLPLYADETKPHIQNPVLLPLPISHPSCHDVVELVKAACIANVTIDSVTGIAFIFLTEDVMSFLVHIQGMRNAFIIHFKFCPRAKCLVPLSPSSFFCFPDLSIAHRNIWSESYGQSIFSAMECLQQEMWRFLCRYGSSQGNFPKALIKLYLPSIFTHYFGKFFNDAGVESQVIIQSEPNRQIEKFLIYRMISINQTFRHFSLETEAQLNALASLLGSMSVFGVWTRMPRQNAERAIRVMDTVNCLSKAEFFVALCGVLEYTWLSCSVTLLLCFYFLYHFILYQ